MVCELQFSRPIGLLHGALLSSGKLRKLCFTQYSQVDSSLKSENGNHLTVRSTKGKSGEGTKGRQLRLNEALKEVIFLSNYRLPVIQFKII